MTSRLLLYFSNKIIKLRQAKGQMVDTNEQVEGQMADTHVEQEDKITQIDYTQPDQMLGTEDAPVVLEVGDKFEVKAEENPSTGYIWLLLDKELEFHKMNGVIKQADSRFEANQTHAGQLVGAPGTRYMTIEGVGEGEGICHLILGRPWEVQQAFEKNEIYEPVQDIKINVKVGGDITDQSG